MYEKLAVIITNIISGFIGSASGFWGWILKLIFKPVSKKIVQAGEHVDNKIEAKKESKDDLEKYNEAIAKPEITKEERLNADRDLLGG